MTIAAVAPGGGVRVGDGGVALEGVGLEGVDDPHAAAMMAESKIPIAVAGGVCFNM